MKMTAVRDREIAAVSLRRACDMRRAWSPGNESPMSPSISARGTSAATESTMMTSTAFDLTSASHISSACSPVSGWEMRRSSMLIPIAPAKVGSSACSTSMYADSPPARCACAITCIATVDLPAISGPKISVILPRGMPPPNATSSAREPVGIVSTVIFAEASPNRIMEPLPNCFSIWPIARSSARRRSSPSLALVWLIVAVPLFRPMVRSFVTRCKSTAS